MSTGSSADALAALRPDLFAGRTVLVTGGTSGIGAAVARGFARLGAEVTATGGTEAEVAAAGGLMPGVRLERLDVRDGGTVADLVGGKAMVALTYGGEPLEADHGGPARLLVPHLYLWKSAKWLTGLQFTQRDEAGFWELRGYHMYGDPWREQRYSGD